MTYLTVKNGKKTATLKEKYLTGATDACGYKHLRLVTDDGKTVLYKIHTLIYLAFNPDYKHAKEKYGRKIIIHHKDHNKQNNRLENLELLSAAAHSNTHKPDKWKTYYQKHPNRNETPTQKQNTGD